MWDRKQIKARGKAAFKANYWACVIVGLLLTLIVGGTAIGGRRATNTARPNSTTTELTEQLTEIDIAQQELTQQLNSLTDEEKAIAAAAFFGILAIATIVSIVLKVFLFNPLQVGCYRFFRMNAQNSKAGVGLIGEGFGSYGHVFVTLLLRDLLIALWSLLLIIPGIIKSYSYEMVPYIIKDRPDLSSGQVLKLSSQMMQGNKMQAFIMDLSFIGWFLLGTVTFGLAAVFWATPYYECSKAALYLELSNQTPRY